MTVILGLTGSIGMGKSTVANMLRDENVPVFDADAEVHRLQGLGGALVADIEAAFPGTTGPDGVDRNLLSAKVLRDRTALERLEAIVHPAIHAAREAFVRANSNAPVLVFDIPLLFEKGHSADIDAVLVVSAPPDVQRSRVLARPEMTPEKLASILALQMPDAEKRALADHVIDTSAPPAATRAQIRAILACFRSGKGQ
jgi:dephospho-CoA kinase